MDTRRKVGSYKEEHDKLRGQIIPPLQSEWYRMYVGLHKQVKSELIDSIFEIMDSYLTRTKHPSRLRLFPFEQPIFKKTSKGIRPGYKFEALIDGVMSLQDAGTGEHGKLFTSGRDQVIAVVSAYKYIERFTNLQRAMNFFAVYMAIKDLLPTLPENGLIPNTNFTGYFDVEPFSKLVANLRYLLDMHPQFQASRFWFVIGQNQLSNLHLHEVLCKLETATKGAGAFIPRMKIKKDKFNDDSIRLERMFVCASQVVAKHHSYEYMANVFGLGQYRPLRISTNALVREVADLESKVRELSKRASEMRAMPRPDLDLLSQWETKIITCQSQILRSQAIVEENNKKLLALRKRINLLVDDSTLDVAKKFLDAHLQSLKSDDPRCGEMAIWRDFLGEHAKSNTVIEALEDLSAELKLAEPSLLIEISQGFPTFFSTYAIPYLDPLVKLMQFNEMHRSGHGMRISVGSADTDTSTLTASSAGSVPSDDSNDSDPESPIATINTHRAPPESSGTRPMLVPPKDAILYEKASPSSVVTSMPKPSAPPAEVCARGREARFISNARPNAGAGLPSIHYPRQ